MNRTEILEIMQGKKTKVLKIIEGDPGNFAVEVRTEHGRHARGRLNFDQVVAILERYFVFKDDSDFTMFDDIWKIIDTSTRSVNKKEVVKKHEI